MAGLMGSGSDNGNKCIYSRAYTTSYFRDQTLFSDSKYISGNRFIKDAKIKVNAAIILGYYSNGRIKIGSNTLVYVDRETQTGGHWYTFSNKELSVKSGDAIDIYASDGNYGSNFYINIVLA